MSSRNKNENKNSEIDLEILKKAYAMLVKFMENNKTEQEQAGIIQAFEFCYELSWKIMKKFLYKDGITVNSPRTAFREAWINGYIKNAQQWFEFLDARNMTVHTYNEVILKELMGIIPKFKVELGELLEFLEKKDI